MKYELPKLPYEYNALEPYIDAQTMEIHHSKHHQGYVDKLNAALESSSELQEKSLEDLLRSLESVPQEIRTAVRNNGGGHYNHSLFWKIMRVPTENNNPEGSLAEAINGKFSDFSSFKDKFVQAATTLFGSGWTWLVADSSNELQIITTPNQDNPVTTGLKPLLGLDIWEHAYYLKYQNRRPEYIKAWWQVVNWQEVEQNYTAS